MLVEVVVGDRLVPAVVAEQLDAGAVADHVRGRARRGGPHLGRILGGPAERQGEVGERVSQGISHDTHADMIGAFAYGRGRFSPNATVPASPPPPAILELWLPFCGLAPGLCQPQLQDRGA